MEKKKFVLCSGLVLLVVVIVGTIIMPQKEKKEPWSLFESMRSEVNGVSIQIDNEGKIDKNAESISFKIVNDGENTISFFYETMEIQKKSDNGWLTWKQQEDSNLPSAEIEHIIRPEENESVEISLAEIVPRYLMDPGQYRIYIPVGFFYKEADRWENGYLSSSMVIE